MTSLLVRAGLTVGAVAALAFLTTRRESSIAGPTQLEEERNSSSYSHRLGLEVYRHYCETCHGAEGRGEGFNAFNLPVKPRDFTSPEFQRGRTDRELEAVIETGGEGAGLSAAMPPWGRTLSPSQRRAVVTYIRRLRAQPAS